MNDVFGCWYEPGDAGTWLTWFINQHNDYPKFTKKTRFEQEDNALGHIATDYSCFNSDWHIEDWSEYDSKETWSEYVKKISQLNDETTSSVCYKLLPWHNPFCLEPDEIVDETPAELCVRLLTESNTKAVIMPVVTVDYELFAKRLAFIRPRFTTADARTAYKQRIERIYDNTLSMMRPHVTVHTVSVDKLILHTDDAEYNKLLDVLQQPAIANWKELCTEYYATVLQPLESIADVEFDSRPETLEGNGENPYS